MQNYPIEIGEYALTKLIQHLTEHSPTQLLVLDDTLTHQHCYPQLASLLPDHWVYTIPAGEQHKHLGTCTAIWEAMTEHAMDRKALVVNLGGGVIGDMGGFVAATYKRGIDFVQVPTTLLAQVDASVGGKLGIDFQGYKNHIGLYREPLGVYIWPQFLRTLPLSELRSGFAEVIKHHLIADGEAWQSLRQQIDVAQLPFTELIQHSVHIKADIVAQDPFERGLRKALNFGHTIGHALETVRLDSPQPLLHGEAIAVGMVAEAYLSQQAGHLSEDALTEITQYMARIYPSVSVSETDLMRLHSLAQNDKKNERGHILCTFLGGIGQPLINQPISENDILAGMAFYQQMGGEKQTNLG